MAVMCDDGYQILTTDEMIELLAQGAILTLPETSVPKKELQGIYSEEDLIHLNLAGDMNDVVAIEYVGEEEVQCIAIDDPEHLYMTDNFIPTHNTSNIVFLKSTDDSMLETLEKMSGKRHQAYINSKQVTRDIEKIWLRTEGKASYTMSTVEEPVISYNDMAFISERNSIVFRAGDSPIWNRNETILPMSWRLFQNKIKQPGYDYTLQTIPTLSSAIDFDVRANQPNFEQMLEKRIRQASLVKPACDDYRRCFGYDDYDIAKLDLDVYAETIMGIVNARKNAKDAVFTLEDYQAQQKKEASVSKQMMGDQANSDQLRETERIAQERQNRDEARFANKKIAPSNLFDNMPNHQFDQVIIDIFLEFIGDFKQDTEHFTLSASGCLLEANTELRFIEREAGNADTRMLEQEAKNVNSRVYAEEGTDFEVHNGCIVTDHFLKWLSNRDTWADLAGGVLEREMARYAEG